MTGGWSNDDRRCPLECRNAVVRIVTAEHMVPSGRKMAQVKLAPLDQNVHAAVAYLSIIATLT